MENDMLYAYYKFDSHQAVQQALDQLSEEQAANVTVLGVLADD